MQAAIGAYTSRTILLCFAGALIEGIDLQSAGVAAPKMAPALNLNSATLGWVFSASTFGMFIGALIGGYCADRIGRKRVLVASMLVLGVFSLGTTQCRDLLPLLLMRLLTGIGLGSAIPNLIALATENSPDGSRGRWVALMYGGIPMGVALASWITLQHGEDWRTIFLIGGVAPLLLAPVMAWGLPESQRFELVRQTTGGATHGSYRALLGANQALTTILIWITGSCTLLVIYTVSNWLPSLLVALGLHANQVSGVQLALGLGGVVGTVLIGILIDGRWRTHSLATVYGIATLLLICLATAPLQVAVIAAIGFMLGVTLQSTTAIVFAIAPLCYDTAHRSTGVGASVAAGRIGAIAGPIVVGAMMSSGSGVARVMLSMVPFMLLALVCASWVTWRVERLGRVLR